MEHLPAIFLLPALGLPFAPHPQDGSQAADPPGKAAVEAAVAPLVDTKVALSPEPRDPVDHWPRDRLSPGKFTGFRTLRVIGWMNLFHLCRSLPNLLKNDYREAHFEPVTHGCITPKV